MTAPVDDKVPYVVVVDDDPVSAQAVADTLRLQPFEATVRVFTDPRQALRHMGEHPPDLLVTDLRMPFLDGLRLIERARAQGESIPAVLMTAYELPTSTGDAVPDDLEVIAKPWDPSELGRVVETTLGKAGLLRPPMGPSSVKRRG